MFFNLQLLFMQEVNFYRNKERIKEKNRAYKAQRIKCCKLYQDDKKQHDQN